MAPYPTFEFLPRRVHRSTGQGLAVPCCSADLYTLPLCSAWGTQAVVRFLVKGDLISNEDATASCSQPISPLDYGKQAV